MKGGGREVGIWEDAAGDKMAVVFMVLDALHAVQVSGAGSGRGVRGGWKGDQVWGWVSGVRGLGFGGEERAGGAGEADLSQSSLP